jgi:hypothetical protein
MEWVSMATNGTMIMNDEWWKEPIMSYFKILSSQIFTWMNQGRKVKSSVRYLACEPSQQVCITKQNC